MAQEQGDRGAWRRRRGEVQVGWSDADGVVLHGLDPREVLALTVPAAGSGGRVDARGLAGAAREMGVTHRRIGELVDVLRAHDLVAAPSGSSTESSSGAARSRPAGSPLADRHVIVAGAGPLAHRVSTLLLAAGVGRVDLGHQAVDDLDQRLGPPTSPSSPTSRTTPPDLVVLPAPRLVPARWGEPWRRRGVAVLPVALERRRVLVGPLVLDPAGPCLHCLDLVRTDLDGAWPALLAQADDRLDVAGEGAAVDLVPPPLDGDDTLEALAAATVTLLARAHLEGRPTPVGVSVEASLPWPRLDHRRWPRHPDCRHHPEPVRATPHPRTAAPRGTMTG